MTAPAFIQSIPRQVVNTGLSLSSQSYVGAAFGAGQLVTTALGAGTNYAVQFTDLYDLTQFRQVALPDATTNANSVAWDPVAGCFYIGVFVTTNGVPHKAVTVYKLTPDGVVSRLANAVDVGVNYTTIAGYSALCTDSTNIYIHLAGGAGIDGGIVKLACADGSLQGFLRLTDTPSAKSALGSAIGLINSTTLLVAGASTVNSTPWGALVPTSLGSVTNILDSSLGFSIARGVPVSGNLWVGMIFGSVSAIKIASDLSSFATFSWGGGENTVLSYDGTTLWAIGALGNVYAVNPATGNVTAAYPQLVPSGAFAAGSGGFASVVPNGGAIAALSTNGYAFLLPLGDSAAKPPLLGHGAC